MRETQSGTQDEGRTFESVEAIRKLHEAELLEKANVVGVGVGLRMQGGSPTGEVALIVLVTQKIPPEQLTAKDLIPAQIEGVPVDVHAVGEITVQD